MWKELQSWFESGEADAELQAAGAPLPEPALRDRVLAAVERDATLVLSGMLTAEQLDALRERQELLMDLSALFGEAIEAVGVGWDDLHFASSYGPEGMLVAVGGLPASQADRDRAVEVLIELLAAHELADVVQIAV